MAVRSRAEAAPPARQAEGRKKSGVTRLRNLAEPLGVLAFVAALVLFVVLV
jgi:hypothetical protein